MRITKPLLLLLLLFGVTAFMFVYAATRHVKIEAQRFVTEMKMLTVGISTTKNVEELAKRHADAVSDERKIIGSRYACTTSDCEVGFLYENSWLRRIKLSPPVWIWATLRAKNGILVYRRIEMGSGRGPAFFLARVTEQVGPNSEPQFSVSPLWSGGKWRVTVDIAPAATPEQHDQAYGFNLDCLSNLGGCSDASGLLPTVSWGTPPVNPEFSGKSGR